jgi:putative pyruvate formate lyase activating enzyme
MAIIRGLQLRGLNPVTVFNTNGYDTADTIDSLSGYISVFLPDFKYSSNDLSKRFSDVANYSETTLQALKRMYFHMGSSVLSDEKGRALRGLIIRHLVLPGHTADSISVLRTIAEELSTGVHISLMSQYHPDHEARCHPLLGRKLNAGEYHEVLEEMERLGFRNGYIQDPESCENYRPDFSKEHPFE